MAIKIRCDICKEEINAQGLNEADYGFFEVDQVITNLNDRGEEEFMEGGGKWFICPDCWYRHFPICAICNRYLSVEDEVVIEEDKGERFYYHRACIGQD